MNHPAEEDSAGCFLIMNRAWKVPEFQTFGLFQVHLPA